ncbi:MAG: hypothetical protein OXE17_12500 [Chloroflexi bacterium]|nr:hypothetical protein [Chloroflexota bacterium]
MHFSSLIDAVETPALVYDEGEVLRVLELAGSLQRETGCRMLYSVKPLPLPPLLELMNPWLSGFAVSSAFEARLARSVVGQSTSIHFTSPGIRPRDAFELADLCDYVSFNSLSQWNSVGSCFEGRASLGLRVNPGISFLDDERYDPCRENSKLGVPVDLLSGMDNLEGVVGGKLEGMLVHTNCESTDFLELLRTVDCLERKLPVLLEQASWINLGGGYLFPEGVALTPLRMAIEHLRGEYGLEVFLEPGAAYVRSAGHMVSTVLDIFDSGGKRVAVLDATVNHMTELLEFDFEPDVEGHREDGEWEYLLAGCTCLAGDVFGEYSFDRPMEAGDRVVFKNAGSYTLTKAHTFNGVNLPTLYSVSPEGELKLLREFDYEDYAARWKTNASHPY